MLASHLKFNTVVVEPDNHRAEWIHDYILDEWLDTMLKITCGSQNVSFDVFVSGWILTQIFLHTQAIYQYFLLSIL